MKIKIDGRVMQVEREHYVQAKTKQLREFGYATLTEKEVDEQITALESGKKIGDGLTVIGGFMRDEIIKQGDTPW